jgi:peptide/nickel transport system permease protein
MTSTPTRARPRTVGRARAVLRRLGSLVLTLWVASFVVFASLSLVPGDPTAWLLRGHNPSPQARAAIREQYHLDEPFLVRYGHWLGGVLHGDFGRSLRDRAPVSHLLATQLPTTLTLVALSGLLITIVGMTVGAYAALRHGRVSERVVLLLVTIGFATPSFVAAIVLKWIFALKLGIFPTFGLGDGGWGDRLLHLALPTVALSVTYLALVTRITRSAMLEQLSRDHVEVAIARGLPRRQVIWRHVFRNALGPILTVSGPNIAALLVSSMIVEYAFGLPGIGQLLVSAADTNDFPVVQAIVLVLVAAFVIANTLVDLVYPLLDPTITSPQAAR